MKKFLRHALQMLSSNMISLLVGVISTFVVPHILSKYDFGMYRTFYLYTSYVAFLHFGFIDGILLVHSGQNYSDLVKKDFRSYSKVFITVELILSLSIILFSFLFNMSFNLRYIIISLAIYSFVVNVTTYYQYISKSILRFTELSFVTTVQSLCNLFCILFSFFLFFYKLAIIKYEYYITTVILVYGFVMLFYIYEYKELTFGNGNSVQKTERKIISYIKKGILFTVTYQLLVFMNNIDNQFTSTFFSTYVYSEYSFTYSMSLLITTFFGSISALLLPYMRKKEKSYFINKHSDIVSIIFIVIFFLLVAYIPITFIVEIFFSKYMESLKYAIYIFPGLSYSSLIESFIFNSYLYFKKIIQFFLITIINIICSSLVLYIFYLLNGNSFDMAKFSLILLFIWYVSLELCLLKYYKIRIISNMVYSIIMNILFIIIMSFNVNIVINMVIYMLSYVFVTYLFFRDIIAFYYKKIIG